MLKPPDSKSNLVLRLLGYWILLPQFDVCGLNRPLETLNNVQVMGSFSAYFLL